MTILTVCRAGLCRSVSLADILKLHYESVDVLPVGIDFNSETTKNMLYEWADKIVVMEQHYLYKIPEIYHPKVIVCDVGPDVWFNPKHPDLISKIWIWLKDKSGLDLVEHHKVL